MQRISVDPLNVDRNAIATAVAVLRRGGLVAFPTETVYGLGARALHGEDVAQIFVAKGRPSWNPLIVHVTGPAMARAAVVASWPPLAHTLAAAFWPGPLSLVLPRRAEVPREVCAGLSTVGVRVPRHPVALALLEALGEPLAAPSANRFMHISPTTADHVVRSLGERVELVLDGGPAAVGVESTVVDLTGPSPVLLRPGGITLAALQAATPAEQWTVHLGALDGVARPSPGMATRHYAPDAEVRLVPHADGPAWERARTQLPRPLGALRFALPVDGVDHVETLEPTPDAAQAALYGALHRLEALGCKGILLEAPPLGPAWETVWDRLRRAAA